jgi:hypothetical protein
LAVVWYVGGADKECADYGCFSVLASQRLVQSTPSSTATLPPPALPHRNPTKVNAAVIEKLSAEQSASLKAATQRSVTYRLNKNTPDIYNHLISRVQQQGSLGGMLQTVGVPLCHLGYSLSAPAEGMDLQYMQPGQCR